MLTRAELDAGLDHIRGAPRDEGLVRLIVRRPAVSARDVVEAAELDAASGLVGDTWRLRARGGAPPSPETQLTIMGARVIALLAQEPSRWPLAGDQLYVDLDLSEANLPAGTRLALGSAVVQVAAEPHTGCGKFVSRFGVDAMRFVNSAVGRSLRLRGLNARVIRNGTVRVGDVVRKLTDGRDAAGGVDRLGAG